MSKINIIQIEFATPEYDQMVQLRTEILRIPLGLEFYAKDLAKEYQYFHLAAYDEQLQMIGCLVLVPIDDSSIQMKQVAVKENQQNLGIGSLLVAACESFSKDKGYQEMILNARDVAIPFYEKLKYTKVGKPFEEVGIKHYKMKKTIV